MWLRANAESIRAERPTKATVAAEASEAVGTLVTPNTMTGGPEGMLAAVGLDPWPNGPGRQPQDDGRLEALEKEVATVWEAVGLLADNFLSLRDVHDKDKALVKGELRIRLANLSTAAETKRVAGA